MHMHTLISLNVGPQSTVWPDVLCAPFHCWSKSFSCLSRHTHTLPYF